MNFVGILNENEFYSDHYLADIFDGDIRGVLETWNARETEARTKSEAKGEEARDYQGYRAPPKRLASFARDALQTIETAERLKQPAERVKAARRLAHRLLEVFDLPYQPEACALDEADTLVPLLGELCDVDGEPLLWILEALPAAGEEPD